MCCTSPMFYLITYINKSIMTITPKNDIVY